MILRPGLPLHLLSGAVFLLSLAPAAVLAQETFDCKITIGESKWDLTSLAGERTLSRDRDTPPTKFTDVVKFNLCEDLKKDEELADKDQCPAGTRACLTKTNIKENEPNRITAVIPLAKSTLDDMEFRQLSSPNKGISLSFSGPTYPDPVDAEPMPQSFNIDIYCDTENGDPTFKSYDGKEVWVEWRASAGCGFGSSDPPPDNKPDSGKDEPAETSVGSGLGWFFLLLLLAFAVYFILGAYYNYSTYGASGMDLIPHRDFWREVPYMLRDVVSHLCSAVRPRAASRGGYIAV